MRARTSQSSVRRGAELGSISLTLRVVSIVAGLGMLGLLLVARFLEPAASGMGTHQQLGLPPCSSILLWGMPCPACGMTTSWSLFTRGQWLESASVNIGGFLLALIALAYVPAGCYFGFTGRASRNERFSLGLAIALVTALAFAVFQWAVRLWLE